MEGSLIGPAGTTDVSLDEYPQERVGLSNLTFVEMSTIGWRTQIGEEQHPALTLFSKSVSIVLDFKLKIGFPGMILLVKQIYMGNL